MIASDDRSILGVILRQRLTLCFLRAVSEQRNVVGRTTYHSASECGAFNGFYDWLFNKDNQLVGHEFSELSNGPCSLPAAVAAVGASYVEMDRKPGVFRIYFGSVRGNEPRLTIAGEFYENAFGRSEDGELLITFGTGALSEKDLQYLRTCGAEWIRDTGP